MARPRSRLRNRAEEGLVLFFLDLFGPLGAEGADRLGRTLGLAARHVLRRRRRLAEANIARAYPEKSADQVKALSREVWAHFGGLFAGLLRDVRRPLSDLLDRVEVAGEQHLREAASRGRGVFLLTGHIGNWETGALATAGRGFPSVVVARPLDNPLLERRLRAFREASGNRVVPKREAVRAMLKTLREGGSVGIMPDQHSLPPGDVAVPFFGRPAATTTSVARLAVRTGALVVPAFCLRAGPGRWRLEFHPPVDVSALPAGERTVEEVTARVTRLLEEAIRRTPEQWLWLHNRWRLDTDG